MVSTTPPLLQETLSVLAGVHLAMAAVSVAVKPCWWCIAAHGLGLLAAALVLVPHQARPSTKRAILYFGCSGLTAGGVLAGLLL
jgi:hypothetical protein